MSQQRVRAHYKKSLGKTVGPYARGGPKSRGLSGSPGKVTFKRSGHSKAGDRGIPPGSYPYGAKVHRMEGRDPLRPPIPIPSRPAVEGSKVLAGFLAGCILTHKAEQLRNRFSLLGNLLVALDKLAPSPDKRHSPRTVRAQRKEYEAVQKCLNNVLKDEELVAELAKRDEEQLRALKTRDRELRRAFKKIEKQIRRSLAKDEEEMDWLPLFNLLVTYLIVEKPSA